MSLHIRTTQWAAPLHFNQMSKALPVIVLSAIMLSCSKDPAKETEGSPAEQKSAVASSTPAAPAKEDGRSSAVSKLGTPIVYEGKLTSLSQINVLDAKLEQVVPPLEYPWAFEFINNDEILLTQISGRLLRINLKTGETKEITGLPDVGQGFTQIGLLDVEIHPNFAANQRIYLSYSRPDEVSRKYHSTEVATAILEGDKLTGLKNILNNEYYGWAPSNFGGALEFDKDGLLYVSIGDRGEERYARHGDKLVSKILRINDDGSTPLDNPFVGREGYDPRVYAVGARNAQGLHFDEETGHIFEVEHGPLGGDEVNILKAGADYGWPTASYGAVYATGKQMGEGTHREGIDQPLFYFLPSIAAAKITVYRGNMFKEWDGDLLVSSLRGEHVEKLDYDQGVIRSSRGILHEVGGRLRDIKVGPDGSIYILSQTHGLHRLYREKEAKVVANLSNETPEQVAPAGPSTAPVITTENHSGKKYYDLICSGCHDVGAGGAPKLGDYHAWKPIINQPLGLTRDHVMNGYKGMPEKGFCNACGPAEVMNMVDYMFLAATESK